jgi:SAM-dependent methyltransferase
MGTFAAPTADSWGEEDNARRYDAYARTYPNYRETSRDLIAVALQPAAVGAADAAVLDLACGTGATTREILAVLGPGGRVTGVDKSAAMLGVAASSTDDTRARWIQAPAEHVDQHVTGQVDAVLCNSAIWQTDFQATAMAVRSVLAAEGCFAFNVPVEFLGEGDSHGSGDRYPALLSEMRAIAQREFGWTPDDRASGRVRQRPTRDSIRHSLAAAGLALELVTEVSHQESAESQRAWLSIPIFTRDGLRGLPYSDRMRVLDMAYEVLGPGQAERALWVVFAARPGDSGPAVSG